MFRNPLIDFAVIVLAALLIFGPKRLPSLGRGLGQGMKEFKDGITGKSAPEEEDAERPALTPASSSQAPAAEPAQAPAAATTSADRGPTEVGSSEPRS